MDREEFKIESQKQREGMLQERRHREVTRVQNQRQEDYQYKINNTTNDLLQALNGINSKSPSHTHIMIKS